LRVGIKNQRRDWDRKMRMSAYPASYEVRRNDGVSPGHGVEKKMEGEGKAQVLSRRMQDEGKETEKEMKKRTKEADSPASSRFLLSYHAHFNNSRG
jgi:hypothetical protein